MKKAILFIFPVLAFADISNVRVTGMTSTQAILAYTAPDNGACTVAVSESASYSPLVHDVDSALFSGANSDSRPGTVNSGRSRVFVAGTRSVEKDLAGHNSSRALQAATLHYFRITCPSDGSTATGKFTTQTIPGGVGYGDPIPIDPANNGNYLYPTISTTDRNAAAIDPHTGALVKNLTLASDLTDATFGMTSSGLGFMCNRTPVKASDENKYGYHCQLRYVKEGGGLSNLLYWIAPDGEARFLGVMESPYVEPYMYSRHCYGSLSHTMANASNPNVFYCNVAFNPSGYGVMKGVYAGHDVVGDDAGVTGRTSNDPSGMPHTKFTMLTPSARDLGTLTNEFDPRYSTYIACCNQYYFGDWMADEKMVWYSYGASQDTLAWISIFDVNATATTQTARFGSAKGCVDNPAVTGKTYAGQSGCIVASTGTFTGGPGNAMRWNYLHTAEGTEGTPGYFVATGGATNGSFAYSVTLTSPLDASPGRCTMTKPSGRDWITDWPDSTWPAGCSTIHVSGEPVTAQSNYPSPFAAEAGDILSQQGTSGGSYVYAEIIRLLDKGSDGKTWYIQRQYLWGAFRPLSTVSTGGKMYMISPGVLPDNNQTGWRVWWDYVHYPLNDSYLGVTAGTGAHMTYVNHATYGRWTYANGTAQSGADPAVLKTLPFALQMSTPNFNGFDPRAVETHPAMSVTNPAGEYDYRQVIDNRPYEGNSALVTASNVSALGGQLYRIRGTDVGSNYKLIPHFANSGTRAMKEVSGPAARLTADSSAQFQWCVALKAGECYGGSLAGDIYFNAPDIANAYCTANWMNLQTTLTIANDICVSPSQVVTQAIQMQSIVNDPFGLQSRVISNSLSKYEQESAFWNSRTIPDGSWLFTTLAGYAGSLKLIKIPPQAKDSVNRTTFVPISVSLAAVSGVDNAIIQFGYGENGDPGSFYCTARQEACVAQSATINAAQPFYFATTEAASITGVPCRSGCTVTIPGLPGRVVYYSMSSRDSLGRVVGRQSGAQAVP